MLGLELHCYIRPLPNIFHAWYNIRDAAWGSKYPTAWRNNNLDSKKV